MWGRTTTAVGIVFYLLKIVCHALCLAHGRGVNITIVGGVAGTFFCRASKLTHDKGFVVRPAKRHTAKTSLWCKMLPSGLYRTP
jgi:hypothetical protein